MGSGENVEESEEERAVPNGRGAREPPSIVVLLLLPSRLPPLPAWARIGARDSGEENGETARQHRAPTRATRNVLIISFPV